MKKLLTIISISLLVLSGCKDAYTKVSNSNETLVSIADTKITKGEIYTTLLNNYSAYYTINDITKKVLNAEIETTDELVNTAKERVEEMKKASSATAEFDVVLKANGFKNEDELLQALINIEKTKKLLVKYVDENFEELSKKYNPQLAVILSFKDVDSANAALTELKNGVDAAEVATAHNSTTVGTPLIVTTESKYDEVVKSTLNTAKIEDGFVTVTSSDGSTTYLVKIIENDVNQIKEDAVNELTNIDDIANESDSYYFKKHNFRIYDKSLLDILSKNFPKFVVQK